MSDVFKVRMKTGNSAFEDGDRNAEVARILRKLADRVENGDLDNNPVPLIDMNGNTVGEGWFVKETL